MQSQEYKVADYEHQKFHTPVRFAYNKNRFSYDMARYHFACWVSFMILLLSTDFLLKLHVSFFKKTLFQEDYYDTKWFGCRPGLMFCQFLSGPNSL